MKIDIENEICLGVSHSGAVTTNGKGILELEDNEVSLLITLINEKKTTDVKELGIRESYPDLYEKLREAYHDIAYRAEELHWLWEGYYESCYQYDADELKMYCMAYCGFEFDYDDDKYINEEGELDEELRGEDEDKVFYEWLEIYLSELDDDSIVEFFYNQMNAEVNLEDIYYEVEIPKPIIEMAKSQRNPSL